MNDDPRYDPKEFRRPSRNADQDRIDLILAVVLAVAFIFVLNFR